LELFVTTAAIEPCRHFDGGRRTCATKRAVLQNYRIARIAHEHDRHWRSLLPSFAAPTKPTIAFIGVTTGGSSILQVFPAWARRLGIEAEIVGIDFAPRSDPAAYRATVEALRDEPLMRGALVTTHKLALYDACQDLFDEIDPHARAMAEVSCISKRGGRLRCDAKDPITSGLALDGFLPVEHFASDGADAFVIGAGGSAIALTWHLMRRRPGVSVPTRIFVSDRDPARLAEIGRIHAGIETDSELVYVLSQRPEENDSVVATLRRGSLIVNATGLGKDEPGSPITSGAVFPIEAIAWDLNYRGNLLFLDQARRQQHEKRLQVEDGWTYFLHGWLSVIAEVFEIEIASAGPQFDELSRIAADASAARR
jgi:shikimate 5-dehydrogenase